MTTEQAKVSLFRISPFLKGGRTRYICQNIATYEPSVSLSLYEQHLSHKQGSHNTVRNDLKSLIHLYSWALQENVNIEDLLLNGLAPAPVLVRKFAYWLSKLRNVSADIQKPMSITASNRILDVSARLFAWYIRHHGEFEGVGNEHHLDREAVVTLVQKLFRGHKLRNPKKTYAGDLSEEEVATIEKFLKPSNRTDVSEAVAQRDYLIWRLAIEFGLRDGEILALRLGDCPHGKQNFIKIVRIEERGPKYCDPRGVYAPRPKTLSRDLGFVLDHSPIPEILGDYVSVHRCHTVKRNGKTRKLPILSHDFLITNHMRKSGTPLSMTGIQKIAETISRGTGVAFHWHLARHAFFNRAYAAIIDHPELNDRVLDLVYFGGWADEKSLQLYVNRARRERAITAITFWQVGANQWDALK